jgi:hypothetical protein
MILYFIVVIFSFAYGLSKSVSDTLTDHYSTSIFSTFKNKRFWNFRSVSSANKWKNGNKAEGEAFLGSSTIFVMFTDGSHLFDFLRDIFLIGFTVISALISIHINDNYLDKYTYLTFGVLMMAGYVVSKLIFELFYSSLFRIK